MSQTMSFDKDADDYDAYHGGLERGRKAAADIAPHLVPGTVLEVGVGTGLVAYGVRELGHPVVGIDIAPQMAARAGYRLDGMAVLGTAEKLPFGDDSLPNVIMVHLLHVVDDMKATLSEAARVLAPGGRLVAVHGVPEAEPDDMVAAAAALDVLKPEVPDTPEKLHETAASLGLRLVTTGGANPYELDITPEEYADSIAGRVWSYLKDVDEDDWERLVVPTVAALRALPDPTTARHQVWQVPISVFTRD
ncbi:class I SAM-dependent methyltransferase [Actinosynnema sp. NPDC059797]